MAKFSVQFGSRQVGPWPAFPSIWFGTSERPIAAPHCRPVFSLFHASSKARWPFFMLCSHGLPCRPENKASSPSLHACRVTPRPCLSTSRHPRLRGYSPLQHPCADLVWKSRSNAPLHDHLSWQHPSLQVTAPARPLHQLHPLPANSSSPFAESTGPMSAWSQLAI